MAPLNLKQIAFHLRDYTGLTHRLLTTWSDVPLQLMPDEEWEKGPLVIIGSNDRMMWPLLPPGTLLRLNPKARKIEDRSWPEFERPIYLVEYKGRFYCCHLQRRGDMLRLISHLESPAPPSFSVPCKDARVRGQLTLVFRPLPTRGTPAGRPQARLRNPQ